MWYAFHMSENMRRFKNLVMTLGLVTVLSVGSVLSVFASSIGEVQQNLNQHQNDLNKWQNQIAGLEDEQDILEEQISDLNAEIINTIASIDVKEEEIAAKETAIEEKRVQIGETQVEYEAAVVRENDQRDSMTDYARMMYENKETDYINAMLAGKGLSDILNQMDFVEKIYEYSLFRLNCFIETKNNVHDLWDYLEEQKTGLEQDKVQLEDDKAVLDALKADLDVKLEKLKKESANYDAQIKAAKKSADAVKKQIQADKALIKKLEEEQKRQQMGNNITISETNYSAMIDAANGSDLGKKIAKYACQFIGNPYVAGGTSLTKGADCSGFTYRCYQDFGMTIPRTSFLQRSAGTGVEYANAQPGDLICYDGHVGMYIGNGMIVHASNKKTGIKVSKAQYRTILAVRRIVK